MRKLTLEAMVPTDQADAFDAGSLSMMVVPVSIGEVSGVQHTMANLNDYHGDVVRKFTELAACADDEVLKARFLSLSDYARVAEQWHKDVMAILRRSHFIGRKQGGPVQ